MWKFKKSFWIWRFFKSLEIVLKISKSSGKYQCDTIRYCKYIYFRRYILDRWSVEDCSIERSICTFNCQPYLALYSNLFPCAGKQVAALTENIRGRCEWQSKQATSGASSNSDIFCSPHNWSALFVLCASGCYFYHDPSTMKFFNVVHAKFPLYLLLFGRLAFICWLSLLTTAIA